MIALIRIAGAMTSISTIKDNGQEETNRIAAWWLSDNPYLKIKKRRK